MRQDMPVTAFMTRRVASLAPSDDLDQVRRLLEDAGFHHIPVLEDHRLVGILSYTDYIRAIHENFRRSEKPDVSEKRLHALHVRDIMTPDPVTLKPGDPLRRALRLFSDYPFHALPVVDEAGALLGMVTTTDVMKFLEGTLAPDPSYDPLSDESAQAER